METILQRLQQVFDAERLAAWLARLIPDVILALLVFAVYYFSLACSAPPSRMSPHV